MYCHCMRYRSDSTWIRRHLLQKSFHNNFAKLVLLTLLLLLPWYANRQGGEDLNLKVVAYGGFVHLLADTFGAFPTMAQGPITLLTTLFCGRGAR